MWKESLQLTTSNQRRSVEAYFFTGKTKRASDHQDLIYVFIYRWQSLL